MNHTILVCAIAIWAALIISAVLNMMGVIGGRIVFPLG